MSTVTPEFTGATAQKLLRGQVVFFTVLLTGNALVNSYTVFSDRARLGQALPLAVPMTWEFSSALLLGLLLPVQAWWLSRFPLSRQGLRQGLPAHLLATAPYSLVHTEGMILLRKLVYWWCGSRYDFGPFWSNWVYEYRKDFITYWVMVGALLAFHVYGLWLQSRESAQPAGAKPIATDPDAPLDRLVVRRLNREFVLNTADIDRIEADGNYVVVHAAGQNYRLRESLDGLARRLGERRFARVHRAHLVNLDRVREIQPWDHGDYRILLKDGSFVNFSRRYRSRLEHLFG